MRFHERGDAGLQLAVVAVVAVVEAWWKTMNHQKVGLEAVVDYAAVAHSFVSIDSQETGWIA